METKYYYTIGLEIHAELNTETKMFCDCKNDPEEKRPNVNICPVCMAHPGSLPVINKGAVENVIKIGLAVGGVIADFTEFDRKNYFYPDIPKGYQISQYKYPIVSGGHLAGMAIRRVHLEEDTGTSKHDHGDYSLLDFNRAGVPLSELVTEPHTFGSIDEAAKAALVFAREYQLTLMYLDASKANMEKGEMRVEANISVSKEKDVLNPRRVEVKNLNSFKSVERAIAYELTRMVELFEDGKEIEIVQETRGWDEQKQKTFSQRSKENLEDYRYFADPDLPKLMLSEVWNTESLRASLSELPGAKRDRYKNTFGIKDEDIESYIGDFILSDFFEDVVTELGEDTEKIKIASNYITSDMLGLLKKNENLKIPHAHNFAELIAMISAGDISSRAAKDILAMIVEEDESPRKIAEEKDLLQKNDESALTEVAKKIITANPKVVEDYKGGKETSLQFFVGQMMKETKGAANPAVVAKLFKELLS